MLRLRKPAALAILAAALVALSARAQAPPITDYIARAWTTLTRSNQNLAAAAADPKFPVGPSGKWPVYVARTENVDQVERDIRAQMPAADFGKIEIRRLPEDIAQIREQGLLYLPKPYVVPGGRFNEMYGWDSYFIQAGSAEGRPDRAGQGHGRQFSVRDPASTARS